MSTFRLAGYPYRTIDITKAPNHIFVLQGGQLFLSGVCSLFITHAGAVYGPLEAYCESTSYFLCTIYGSSIPDSPRHIYMFSTRNLGLLRHIKRLWTDIPILLPSANQPVPETLEDWPTGRTHVIGYIPPAHRSAHPVKGEVDRLYHQVLASTRNLEYFDNGYTGMASNRSSPMPTHYLSRFRHLGHSHVKGLHLIMRYFDTEFFMNVNRMDLLEELAIDYIVEGLGYGPEPNRPVPPSFPNLRYLAVTAPYDRAPLEVIHHWRLDNITHFICRNSHTPESHLEMALEGFGDGLISLGLAGKYFISAEFLDLARLTPRLTSLEYDVGPGIPLLNGHPTLESLVLHCPAPAIPGTDIHAKLCVLLDIICDHHSKWKKLRFMVDTTCPGRCSDPFYNLQEHEGFIKVARLDQKAVLKVKRAAALAPRQAQHRSKKQEAMIRRIPEKACGSGSIAQPTTGAAAETQITLPVVNSKTNLVIVLRQLWVELWSKEEEPEWEIFFKELFKVRIAHTHVLDWAGFKAEVRSEGIKLQNTIRLGEVLQKEALDRTYTASGKALS
ncbi:hypothetical protein M422DRAFT_239060 [Sphaerobolus stellatus SS14]|nr:hypothetical protein M422DRAFT_239060 [Sphaerobolus stellatus SS14]